MINVNMEKDNELIYRSHDEEVIDDIYNYTFETLTESVREWENVERVFDKYHEMKSRLLSVKSTQCDNGLECKIMNDTHVSFDTKVIELVELEKEYSESVRLYNKSYEHVKQLLLDSNLTDIEYRVMSSKYLYRDYPTFETVSKRARITQSYAFRVHKKAFVKVAQYLEKKECVDYEKND